MIDIKLHNNHHKFHHDAINYEDDSYVVRTDGVFLNFSGREKDALAKHLIGSYLEKGEAFAKDLRGSFQVYIHDKVNNKQLVYTNHIGDKRIYYYHSGKVTLISNSITTITSTLKRLNLSYTLDQYAVYYMLTFGYMFGDRTLVEGVRLLKPGHFIRLAGDRMEIEFYFILDNKPDPTLTEHEALERADELFRNAVSLGFEKDMNYGLTPLCSLSGGLDSRMTTWVGHELGYGQMINFTFSQPGHPDMTIPEKIVQKLNHRWTFIPLDDPGFMCKTEDVTKLTQGSTSYLPISHGKSAIDQVDFTQTGLLHTGQLGDVTLSSFMNSEDYGEPAFTGAVSNHFIHKLPREDLQGYGNLELMLYLNRGMNCALSGNLTIQQHSESVSPFLDVDYLEFCMSIPLRFRIRHRLYKQWILRKYPDAAAYQWEKLGRRITAKTVTIRGKTITYSKLPAFVIQGMQLHLGITKKEHLIGKKSMIPFQYWYESNSEVFSFVEQYYKDNIDLISEGSIKKDCESLYQKGSIFEKSQVLTLLAAIKLFWD